MSTSIFSLVLIMENILKEVGDLENIERYETVGNSFVTDEGWRVNVTFDSIDPKDHKILHMPVHVVEAISVGYDVEGVESQFQKSGYRTLIRILKTVTILIADYIRVHPEVQAMLVLPSNKSEEVIASDPQKHLIYKSILVHQTSILGWTLKDFHLSSYNGFILYKKEPSKNILKSKN